MGDWAYNSGRGYGGSATSLQSPALDGSNITVSSNTTLEVCNDFVRGMMRVQVIALVRPLNDIFIVYVDGEIATQLVAVNEWSEVALSLQPGPYMVNFRY